MNIRRNPLLVVVSGGELSRHGLELMGLVIFHQILCNHCRTKHLFVSLLLYVTGSRSYCGLYAWWEWVPWQNRAKGIMLG